MSTIKDVAEKAGVSFTTVSHVLNGTRPVSDEARTRVERAVADLGYLPSAVARALKTSTTRILGVLVPNIVNPFFSELTRGIEDQCRRSQYAVFLCNCDDDAERQTRYLQTLLSRRVDGLVLATAANRAEAGIDGAELLRIPSVVVDRQLHGVSADQVRVDNRLGARLAVEHLLGLGHRRIACLAGPPGFDISHDRTRGWQDALAGAGIEPHATWLLEGDFSAAAGHALACRLLHTPRASAVTAIFAANDLQAIGALRAAAERGVTVPGDLSIIGFDGIALGSYLYPALSSVGFPIRKLGERAAQVLQERIAAPSSPLRDVVLAPALVLRESTAPPRSH